MRSETVGTRSGCCCLLSRVWRAGSLTFLSPSSARPPTRPQLRGHRRGQVASPGSGPDPASVPHYSVPWFLNLGFSGVDWAEGWGTDNSSSGTRLKESRWQDPWQHPRVDTMRFTHFQNGTSSFPEWKDVARRWRKDMGPLFGLSLFTTLHVSRKRGAFPSSFPASKLGLYSSDRMKWIASLG